MSELLTISPNELSFSPPYNNVKQLRLVLHNPRADSAVAYKVRTTAPKRYMVRPGTGIIPPESSTEVTVFLNLLKDPPKDNDVTSLKDKFQIQEVDVSLDSPDGLQEDARAELVKSAFASNKNSVRSQKLKTVFVDDKIVKEKQNSSSSSSPSSNDSSLSQDLSKVKSERDEWKRKYEMVINSDRKANAAAANAAAQAQVSPLMVGILSFILGYIVAKYIF